MEVVEVVFSIKQEDNETCSSVHEWLIQNTVILEKYPLGWHISTCHRTDRSWQCQIKILLFKKKKKEGINFYFHKYIMILITPAQKKSTQEVIFKKFCFSVPWINCYFFFPGKQHFKYIFHSVTKWHKKFLQDSTGHYQINVTYLIFQVSFRCLLRSPHQSVLICKKLVPRKLCALPLNFFFCVTLIILTVCKMQPSAKKEI